MYQATKGVELDISYHLIVLSCHLFICFIIYLVFQNKITTIYLLIHFLCLLIHSTFFMTKITSIIFYPFKSLSLSAFSHANLFMTKLPLYISSFTFSTSSFIQLFTTKLQSFHPFMSPCAFSHTQPIIAKLS